MTKHRPTPSLTLLLALFAQSAQAFFDPPWITPEQPRTGETVFVNIHGGFCDAIATTPGYPLITREGDAIRFVVSGVHEEDVDWCIHGEGTAAYPVGIYPPGTYFLTVEMIYIDFFGQPNELNIGTVPFTVQGAEPAPTPAPASGSIALFAMLISIAGASLVSLRRRLAS